MIEMKMNNSKFAKLATIAILIIFIGCEGRQHIRASALEKAKMTCGSNGGLTHITVSFTVSYWYPPTFECSNGLRGTLHD